MKSNISIPTAQLDGLYFFHAAKDHTVSRHSGEKATLILMLGGLYSAQHDDQRITARAGEVVCWRQGETRIEENDPTQRTRCLVMHYRWKKQPKDLARVVRDAAGLMRMLAFRIFAMTKDPFPAPSATWNIYLNAILAEYLRMSRHQPKDLLDQINQCLEEHLSENFRLTDLARWIGLERHYLGQRFKRETGLSLMHYVKSQRVQHALGYLATSSFWTPRKIAARVGIPDEVQLRRLIRSFTGLGIREIRHRIPPKEILPFAQTLMRGRGSPEK